ncbi:MAG: TonB-dependent receptor [Saprospiraceae bacterium]|nr:TonB-dependent receptor [Saprospiraceae bacterium]
MKTVILIPFKWLLLLVSCLFFSNLQAQTTVAGFVRDIQTGEPLIGASVQINGTNIGAATGEHGGFRFSTSEPLPFTLEVSYLGYTPKKIVVAGRSEYLAVYLEGVGFTSEEIVVTASRWKEKIYESPASLTVVPTAILEAQAVPNPMLVLKYTPGVQINVQGTERLNIGLREGRQVFITRTQILLDNRTLSSSGLQFFDASNSALSLLDMDRVEVVRGAATSIYGPGATRGIIHFLSKDPFKYPGTSVEVTGGERATLQTSMRHAWHSNNNKFGYKINANFRRSNDWQLDPSDSLDQIVLAAIQNEIIDPRTGEVVYRTNGKLQEENMGYGANATLEFRPADDLSFSFNGGFSHYDGVYRQPVGEQLSQLNEYFWMLKAKFGSLFAQISLNQTGKFNNEHPTFAYRSGEIAPLGRTQWEGQLQYGFNIRPLYTRLILGGDFTHFKANTEGLIFGRYEDSDNYDYAGTYLQTKTALLDQLDLFLAGRLDYYKTFSEFAFSYGISLLYKITENNTLRINFNHADVPLSMYALFTDAPVAKTPAFDIWYLGGKDAQTFAANPSTVSFIPGIGENPGIGMPLQAGYSVVVANLAQFVGPEMTAYLQSQIPNINGFSQGTTSIPLQNVDPIGLYQRNTFEVGFNGRISDRLKFLAEFYFEKQINGYSQAQQISPLVYLPTLGNDLAAVVLNSLDSAALAGFGWTLQGLAGIFQLAGNTISMPNGELSPTGLIETEQMPADGPPHLAFGSRKLNGDFLHSGIDVGLQYSIMETLMFHATYSHEFKYVFEPAAAEVTKLPPEFPQDKFRLGFYYWQLPSSGFRANVNVQYDAEFQVNDSFYSGVIPGHTVVDASIGYQWLNGLSVDVTATNVLNKKYGWPSLPKIGRQVLARAVYTFGKK